MTGVSATLRGNAPAGKIPASTQLFLVGMIQFVDTHPCLLTELGRPGQTLGVEFHAHAILGAAFPGSRRLNRSLFNGVNARFRIPIRGSASRGTR